MGNDSNITADAAALQERDSFSEAGWLKVIAPAKVNLYLAIGARRDDGYHEAVSVMHALNLHDVVYLKPLEQLNGATAEPIVHMVPHGDVAVPELSSRENLAARAITALAEALELPREATALEVRIEKNIPAQAGLGGGSSDAAAALVGALHLWGKRFALGTGVETQAAGMPEMDGESVEKVARSLGADVAFFLHGGCARLEGAGDVFSGALESSRQAIALVKPSGGVSTAAAYNAFDADPAYASEELASRIAHARRADEVEPFNNLARASERIMPELVEVRTWLESQPGVRRALLCGSGAATFALCDDFATACSIVTAARLRGWWARSTSLGSARAMIVKAEGAR